MDFLGVDIPSVLILHESSLLSNPYPQMLLSVNTAFRKYCILQILLSVNTAFCKYFCL